MIKEIIKRDGSKETFQPIKLNRWAEWASNEVKEFVDWSHIVTQTAGSLEATVTSDALQMQLIKKCVDQGTWSYGLMAGSLYGALLQKRIFGSTIPTLKELHLKLIGLGLLDPAVHTQYTDEELDTLNAVLDHRADYHTPFSALQQINEKYTLRDRNIDTVYETQQFVCMRIAMGLGLVMPEENKIERVIEWYHAFKDMEISLATPLRLNIGTPLKAYASCCVYLVGDNAESLAIGDHIAYTMTVRSAGVGCLINSRSLGDKVRNGTIRHQGKLPYFKSLAGAVTANLQNGRGGACTTYFSCFDPEIKTVIKLKNPMAVESKKNRVLDYGIIVNTFFAKKAARNEDIFLFNVFTAPALNAAFYKGDTKEFERLYLELEQNPSFEKTYVSAREILLDSINESLETGSQYIFWIDTVNHHTPFKDTIYNSNLCLEIALPTKEYNSMPDLYSTEDHGRGEIALCTLAAINVFKVNTYKAYSKAMRLAIEALDATIMTTEYPFPHLEVTAKGRMSLGMGMIGLAHHLAHLGLSYTTVAGKQEIHRLAELHMYTAIEQSLALSKIKGLCPYSDKTKWADGWLPIDTYNRNVDKIADFELLMDWEDLRKRVVANGGIRNSSLIAYMPSESSSKATGETNAVYPIRDYRLSKSDNSNVVKWTAPDGDRLKGKYDIVWDVPTKDLIEVYAILQKFTDQTISADLFKDLIGDEVMGTKEMLDTFFLMTKLGLKSRYYQHTRTTKGGHLVVETESALKCTSGACVI